MARIAAAKIPATSAANPNRFSTASNRTCKMYNYCTLGRKSDGTHKNPKNLEKCRKQIALRATMYCNFIVLQ